MESGIESETETETKTETEMETETEGGAENDLHIQVTLCTRARLPSSRTYTRLADFGRTLAPQSPPLTRTLKVELETVSTF